MTGRSTKSKYPGHPGPLQAAGRQLGIASQLAEELLQARWIAWLKRIGRDEATWLLSSTQTLDAALIQRHERSWDWWQLSINEALPWSLELIERFEHRWDWRSVGEFLRRTNVLVLNSSAIDGLMAHCAYLEHGKTVAGATRE